MWSAIEQWEQDGSSPHSFKLFRGAVSAGTFGRWRQLLADKNLQIDESDPRYFFIRRPGWEAAAAAAAATKSEVDVATVEATMDTTVDEEHENNSTASATPTPAVVTPRAVVEAKAAPIVEAKAAPVVDEKLAAAYQAIQQARQDNEAIERRAAEMKKQADWDAAEKIRREEARIRDEKNRQMAAAYESIRQSQRHAATMTKFKDHVEITIRTLPAESGTKKAIDPTPVSLVDLPTAAEADSTAAVEDKAAVVVEDKAAVVVENKAAEDEAVAEAVVDDEVIEDEAAEDVAAEDAAVENEAAAVEDEAAVENEAAAVAEDEAAAMAEDEAVIEEFKAGDLTETEGDHTAAPSEFEGDVVSEKYIDEDPIEDDENDDNVLLEDADALLDEILNQE